MGMLFKAPGVLIYVVCGLWGLAICFAIVKEALGTVVAVFSLVLAPILLALAPWYKALVHGDWYPLVLVYGGGILGSVLYGIGSMIDRD